MKRILIISLLFIACNPVKSVLKDPKKFEQVKEAVIRSGACINDTITIQTIKDSIIYKDSIVNSEVKVPCKDFDTTLADGTRIKVSSGVLIYSKKSKETTKTITITNSIRDKAFENILKVDISKRDSAIKAYMILYKDLQAKIKETEKENKKLKWKYWLVVIIALAWTFRWSIYKLVKPL